ncbi:carbohydrate deacetylase [Acidipropionibacterium virtanenii]|uniref:carbohydrate deacetylase n=1 Tax=Acidipropionibacterium virtanenii TaxID=2057246 RepID=UPI0015F05AF1|nr:ChbG/HpnK family deacetylase [Acidipropionibacterium virtanenii]
MERRKLDGRRLVITADDFGYDPASSALILSLIRGGFVTSTSVLAVSEELHPRHLARLQSLADDGLCSIGLHFATTSDGNRSGWRPLSPQGQILAGPDGRLLTSGTAAERRACSRIIGAELEAQHSRLLEHGLRPTRLDSHSGTLYGLRVGSPPNSPEHEPRKPLREGIRFAAVHNLALRLPRSVRLIVGPVIPPLISRPHVVAVEAADRRKVRLPQEMATNPFPYPLIPGYRSLLAYYLRLLPRLPVGTTEIFLHPGSDSPASRHRFGGSWIKRIWEARMLRDPVWRAALKSQGIELVTSW